MFLHLAQRKEEADDGFLYQVKNLLRCTENCWDHQGQLM